MIAVCVVVLVDQRAHLSGVPFSWAHLTGGLAGLSAGFPLALNEQPDIRLTISTLDSPAGRSLVTRTVLLGRYERGRSGTTLARHAEELSCPPEPCHVTPGGLILERALKLVYAQDIPGVPRQVRRARRVPTRLLLCVTRLLHEA